MKRLIALLFSSLWLTGATYFVATTGNDTTGDGSLATPWLTIAKGCGLLTAGDTLYVRGGTYTDVQTCLNLAGTSANRITISNFPGEIPVITSAKTAGSWSSLGGNIYESGTNGLSADLTSPLVWKDTTVLTSTTLAGLDAENEFFMCGSGCTSTDRIRIYTTGDPTLFTYRVAANLQTGLRVTGVYWDLYGIDILYNNVGLHIGVVDTTPGTDTTNFTISNVTVSYSGPRGIGFRGCAENPTHDGTITNCIVDHTYDSINSAEAHGIKFASNETPLHSYNITVDHCTSSFNAYHGFQLSEGWDGITLKNSIAHDNNLRAKNDGADIRVGLTAAGTRGFIILDNETYNTKYGIAIYGEINNSEFRGNLMHDPTTACVWMDDGTADLYGTVLFYGNVCRDSDDDGIIIDTHNTAARLENNTIDNAVGSAIKIISTTTGATIQNNAILSPTGGLLIESETGAVFTSNHNAFYSPDASPFSYAGTAYSFGGYLTASSQDADSKSVDFTTEFSGYSGDDFTISEKSGTLRNSGTTITDAVVDFRGVKRPQGAAYAIGAYEEFGGEVMDANQ